MSSPSSSSSPPCLIDRPEPLSFTTTVILRHACASIVRDWMPAQLSAVAATAAAADQRASIAWGNNIASTQGHARPMTTTTMRRPMAGHVAEFNVGRRLGHWAERDPGMQKKKRWSQAWGAQSTKKNDPRYDQRRSSSYHLVDVSRNTNPTVKRPSLRTFLSLGSRPSNEFVRGDVSTGPKASSSGGGRAWWRGALLGRPKTSDGHTRSDKTLSLLEEVDLNRPLPPLPRLSAWKATKSKGLARNDLDPVIEGVVILNANHTPQATSPSPALLSINTSFSHAGFSSGSGPGPCSPSRNNSLAQNDDHPPMTRTKFQEEPITTISLSFSSPAMTTESEPPTLSNSVSSSISTSRTNSNRSVISSALTMKTSSSYQGFRKSRHVVVDGLIPSDS